MSFSLWKYVGLFAVLTMVAIYIGYPIYRDRQVRLRMRARPVRPQSECVAEWFPAANATEREVLERVLDTICEYKSVQPGQVWPEDTPTFLGMYNFDADLDECILDAIPQRYHAACLARNREFATLRELLDGVLDACREVEAKPASARRHA